MNIVTLDFETFFDTEYSLTRLTTEEYIRDPRFEVLGVGVKLNSNQTWWYPKQQLEGCFWAFFGEGKQTEYAVLCHHAHFDGLILSHHFGIRPKLWLDTLSMARLVLGTATSLSLDSLAKHYGLAPKSVPYNSFKGKHWHELSSTEQSALADGCLHDVDLTWAVFNELAKEFPASEYSVVDATIRMFTEPSLVGDQALLGKIWTDEDARKRHLLTELGVDESDLQSAERFAELLRAAGVEPDTKPSHTDPDRRIFAFAKTDDFIKTLAEEESEAGDLARARLGIKSSITQTRAERLGNMASRGPLCIYLAPYAAHTLRWGGGDKSNFQNFPRTGEIRHSIRAPDGYLLAKADASQIEARLLDTLAGQWDKVEDWRNGVDQYCQLATPFYGRTITKADKLERQFGKVLKLQSGYGASEVSIQRAAKNGQIPVLLTLDEALQAKQLYRSTHPEVVKWWRFAENRLTSLWGGGVADFGPMNIQTKCIYLPNGTWLDFSSLEVDPETRNWRYQTRKGWQKIWGSSLVAETTQALARVLTAGVIARCREAGLQVVWTTHDDVVLLVKDDQWAQPTLDWLKAEMVRVPDWLPDLPLAVEGELLERYE